MNGSTFDGLPLLKKAPSEAKQRQAFLHAPALTDAQRASASRCALQLVNQARSRQRLLSVERMMASYNLSETEGRMLMELAEALLRVPDSKTKDLLISDKIGHVRWSAPEAQAFEQCIAQALRLAGSVASSPPMDGARALLHRLGMPLVRQAVQAGVKLLSQQFVLAETIDAAMRYTETSGKSLYSFDMLGEAARTEQQAERFFAAYENAIQAVGGHAVHPDPNLNHGVSIKLSALSCRFQTRYWQECRQEIGARLLSLAQLAKTHNVPLTIDAEEVARLQPTLGLFADLLGRREVAGWSGLGVVVQAYNRQAGAVIDWLQAQAKHHARRIAVRLVKGAYWDNEIKVAQEKGGTEFPVFTDKTNTDLAYLRHAGRLMRASRWFHPQFASHNAVTLVAIANMANEIKPASMEIQKLHGMGDAIHALFGQTHNHPLRIYAPIGKHDVLIAYLVRRLLENGTNSSFINQFVDARIAADELVIDPYQIAPAPATIMTGARLFSPERVNSSGYDLDDAATLATLANNLRTATLPPAAPQDTPLDAAKRAFSVARNSSISWQQQAPNRRADCLDRIADYYEAHAHAFFKLFAAEAGKTADDATAELREAVDFCRFYAAEARKTPASVTARGVVVAISPWNFPLAIFTGQIAAALAMGNAVIAKPAEQTPRIAEMAVQLMHQAGIPQAILHLVFGAGEPLGQFLVGCGAADMIVFTGSIDTAKAIERAVAASDKPFAPIIAETGGLNAMIVDATALLERAVDDIITSAFRSAGQRCSALRIVYAQQEIAASLTGMLIGAAQKLRLGAPQDIAVDVGPMIDPPAKAIVDAYIAAAKAQGRLIWQAESPADGRCVPPVMIRSSGIEEMQQEIFGPVLHIASYPAGAEDAVIASVNNKGFGLTFGLHSRIDATMQKVSANVQAGNIYINRNQIGAIVGSQPFGGEGLSGTGPKAGGRQYVAAFAQTDAGGTEPPLLHTTTQLPGPDGEENAYRLKPRGTVLCLHPDSAVRQTLAARAIRFGNRVVNADTLPATLSGIDAVMVARHGNMDLSVLRARVAQASARIIPFISDSGGGDVWLCKEQHTCTNLTASGGNPELLSATRRGGQF